MDFHVSLPVWNPSNGFWLSISQTVITKNSGVRGRFSENTSSGTKELIMAFLAQFTSNPVQRSKGGDHLQQLLAQPVTLSQGQRGNWIFFFAPDPVCGSAQDQWMVRLCRTSHPAYWGWLSSLSLMSIKTASSLKQRTQNPATSRAHATL